MAALREQPPQRTTTSAEFGTVLAVDRHSILFDIGTAFHIHTPVRCGTAKLESCELDPAEVHVGFGAMNATNGAAPMQGQDLQVPHVECPGVGLNIPDTPLSIASLNVCFDETLHGADFQADVSATGADATPATQRLRILRRQHGLRPHLDHSTVHDQP